MVEKLQNKGSLYLFLGYEDNHPEGAHRILGLKNLTIMISRDVRWLGRSYGDHFDTKPDKILEFTNLKSHDEGEEIIMVKGEIKVEEMPNSKREEQLSQEAKH
jgi:hypothetical protein